MAVLHRTQCVGLGIGDQFRDKYFCPGSITFFLKELGLTLDLLTLISSLVWLKILSKALSSVGSL